MKQAVKLFLATFTAAFLLIAFVGQVSAAPIGTACSEPTNTHPTQVNCGTYLDTLSGPGAAGNDAGGPLWLVGSSYTQVAKWEKPDGAASFQFTNGGGAGWNITGTPGNWGTWTLPALQEILFVVVKSSTNFSVYGQGGFTGALGTTDLVTKTGPNSYDGSAVFNGANTGFWATAPTILSGDQGRGISHISFYGLEITPPCEPNDPDCNNPFPVPEPGVLSLLGMGLLGLGLSRRRLKLKV